MATTQDLALSPVTQKLLRENGRLDRKAGKSVSLGWQELAEELGYDPWQRTPAEEAYRDGWYGVE